MNAPRVQASWNSKNEPSQAPEPEVEAAMLGGTLLAVEHTAAANTGSCARSSSLKVRIKLIAHYGVPWQALSALACG